MKQTLGALFLLFSISGFCQKHYAFDYMSEYEFRKLETSKPRKIWMMTNSTDNTYCAVISETDNGKFIYFFHDAKTGIMYRMEITQKEFSKLGNVKAKCRNVGYSSPITVKQKEDFCVYAKKDTLIDGISYKQYGLRKLVKVTTIDRSYGDLTCILENGTAFHKPLFYSDFIGEMKSGQIPNGIAKQSFVRCTSMNRNEYIYKLVSYTQIQKSLDIPGDCDFAPPPAK